MGIPTLVDAIALAPAATLGLLGLCLGLGRSLVAWPMRWLVPFLGALLLALPAALHLAAYGTALDLAGLLVAAVPGALAFLAAIVPLAMFMANLRARVAIWTRSRRIGLVERLLGSLAGIVCGLLLVALPFAFYELLQPKPESDPSWLRGSLLRPYFRDAAEAARGALSLPPPPAKEHR
jgi:uncharacterized membrane protein required for colicin V production